jgi:hypothetical protein
LYSELYRARPMRSLLMMEVVEVSDVDAIALHPITSLLDLDREVLLPAYGETAVSQEYEISELKILEQQIRINH